MGKVSLEDCPLLTWSLGCTIDLSPSLPPRISIARLAITCPPGKVHLKRMWLGLSSPYSDCWADDVQEERREYVSFMHWLWTYI